MYVDGKRVAGDPRNIVLGNRQEIAVVYGGPKAFRSVPSKYTGGWPGLGCGGTGRALLLPVSRASGDGDREGLLGAETRREDPLPGRQGDRAALRPDE